ncbi:YcxB family protein [Leptospira sp. 96542]|nr:YcxB family protein [Leptospira sp. 96542]
MNPKINHTFKIESNDYIFYNFYLQRRQWYILLSLPTILFISINIKIIVFENNSFLNSLSITSPLFLLWISLNLLSFLSKYLQMKYKYRKGNSRNNNLGIFFLEADINGIKIENENSSISYSWDAFLDLIETKNYILLRTSQISSIIINKKSFKNSEEISIFRDNIKMFIKK